MHVCGTDTYILKLRQGLFCPSAHRTPLVPPALTRVRFLELILQRPGPPTAHECGFLFLRPRLYQHQSLTIVIHSESWTGFSLWKLSPAVSTLKLLQILKKRKKKKHPVSVWVQKLPTSETSLLTDFWLVYMITPYMNKNNNITSIREYILHWFLKDCKTDQREAIKPGKYY